MATHSGSLPARVRLIVPDLQWQCHGPQGNNTSRRSSGAGMAVGEGCSAGGGWDLGRLMDCIRITTPWVSLRSDLTGERKNLNCPACRPGQMATKKQMAFAQFEGAASENLSRHRFL